MTSVLQLLDRWINLSFKKYLKLKFSEYSINEGVVKNNLDVSRIRIINPLASLSAGAPALKYLDVNTETTSPGEVKGSMIFYLYGMDIKMKLAKKII